MALFEARMTETLVANARLYAITDATRSGWTALFAWLAAETGANLSPIDHPPPKPLSEFWRRSDIGCAFMCGWPFARLARKPRLLAAPVPSPARYGGRPVYFSDIVVHRDSRARTLEDTFGGTVGWTVEDSNSGFNALRHHLLAYRDSEHSTLYARSVGRLINPLGALSAVAEGRVDVAPVDSFCHDILRAAGHPVLAHTRTIATTAATPIPVLIASAEVPAEVADAVASALLRAHREPCLAGVLADILVERFAAVDPAGYDHLEQLSREAEAARYPVPA